MLGDGTVYHKHLTKLQNQGNETACNILSNVKIIEAQLSKITQLVAKLFEKGFTRQYHLCQTIMRLSNLDVEMLPFFCVCGLTGNATTKGFNVMDNNVSVVTISERYKPFVVSLWICTHIKMIEQQRILLFMDQKPDTQMQSMSDTIECYLQNSKQTQQEYATMYAKCIAYCQDVLTKSLQ